jgi:hypothetical protein
MVMRLRVTVVARTIMQERYFAGLADLTELIQNAIDRSEREVGKLLTYDGADVLGAGVVFRGQERADNRQSLRSHGQAARMAALHELIPPLG